MQKGDPTAPALNLESIKWMLLSHPFFLNIVTQKQDDTSMGHQRSLLPSVMTLMKRCVPGIPFHTLQPMVEMNTSLWNSVNDTITDSNSCCISRCFSSSLNWYDSSGHIHHSATELAGVSLPQEVGQQTEFLTSLHLLEQRWLSVYRWCFNTRLGFPHIWVTAVPDWMQPNYTTFPIITHTTVITIDSKFSNKG